ncbi:transposase [Sporomusa sp.]|uniref:transposase n=1 Tax=Sporomusa sp. TaxID=2078658 RepID=UPI002D7F1797|nr:transposase [Sporomusa sp.]
MTRKTYAPEFRAQVVKEALETGNSALVARRHTMNENIVNRWVREHKHGKNPKPGNRCFRENRNRSNSAF